MVCASVPVRASETTVSAAAWCCASGYHGATVGGEEHTKTHHPSGHAKPRPLVRSRLPAVECAHGAQRLVREPRVTARQDGIHGMPELPHQSSNGGGAPSARKLTR